MGQMANQAGQMAGQLNQGYQVMNNMGMIPPQVNLAVKMAQGAQGLAQKFGFGGGAGQQQQTGTGIDGQQNIDPNQPNMMNAEYNAQNGTSNDMQQGFTEQGQRQMGLQGRRRNSNATLTNNGGMMDYGDNYDAKADEKNPHKKKWLEKKKGIFGIFKRLLRALKKKRERRRLNKLIKKAQEKKETITVAELLREAKQKGIKLSSKLLHSIGKVNMNMPINGTGTTGQNGVNGESKVPLYLRDGNGRSRTNSINSQTTLGPNGPITNPQAEPMRDAQGRIIDQPQAGMGGQEELQRQAQGQG